MAFLSFLCFPGYSFPSTSNNGSDTVTDCDLLKDGLVGYWPFESVNDRQTPDRSPTSNRGRIIGATHTADGRFGHGLLFDGNKDYVAIEPDDSLKPSIPITTSFWVKLHALPTEVNHHVKFVSWKIRNQKTGWHIWSLKGNNYLQALFGDGSEFHRLKTANPMRKDEWKHVLTKRTDTGGELYLNGHKVNVDYDDVTLPDNQFLGLRLGGWDQRHSLNGLMDDVRIYERGLSESEINMLSDGRCAVK